MPDEKQRLAALYAAKEDEELLALAQDMAELTDTARDALQGEIARRNLSVEPKPPAVVVPIAPPERVSNPTNVIGPVEDEEVVDPSSLIAVARYRDLPEALLAKGSLDSAGIQAFLYNDNMVRMDWFWSNLIGGVTLHVPAEDAAAAREILDADPVDFTPDTDGTFVQPRCPACGSTRVVAPGGRGMSAALLWATGGLPIPLEERQWRCEQCGHMWEQPEPAPSAD